MVQSGLFFVVILLDSWVKDQFFQRILVIDIQKLFELFLIIFTASCFDRDFHIELIENFGKEMIQFIGIKQKPDPLFRLTTVLEGRPRFRLTSSYPNSFNCRTRRMKSSARLVRICGTVYMPSLFSGRISFHSCLLNLPFGFGFKNGVKYLSIGSKRCDTPCDIPHL